jgi:hypothetical protein
VEHSRNTAGPTDNRKFNELESENLDLKITNRVNVIVIEFIQKSGVISMKNCWSQAGRWAN